VLLATLLLVAVEGVDDFWRKLEL